ncbi:C-GCAxxG-C-C family protein [Tepidanaerobacter syntrophicus]|uniref:C-GCAxxG-C-C family protein n=1 Tax=Tepidanaerobacter syntrophicus TaxID=224999 RepID=UPI001BD2E2B8|nr:C-GCAxxG-C-C family protein [Tepidanaerobacter syntrophicus]
MSEESYIESAFNNNLDNADWNSVKDYFNANGFNCAESTVKLIMSKDIIDIPVDMIKMMSGFGGGMQRGLVCGAVIAGIATLGLATGRKDPTESREPSAKAVQAFLEEFEFNFGSILCNELTKGFNLKSNEMYAHCTQFVTGAANIVVKIIRDYQSDNKQSNL